MNFGCAPVGCYKFNPCDSDNPSRIIHLAFALKSYSIDKTDADTFLESLLAGELSGEVKIIRSITGEKPRPETAELAGFGLNAIKVGSSTHTINFDDQHAVENLDFYNTFKFGSNQYDLYYFTDGLIWDASGNRVSFYGDPVFTNGPNDLIMGQATIKWTAKISPAPFNEAFDTDEIENGLYYIISAASNPSGQYTVSGSTEEGPDKTASDTLSASLSFYLAQDCDLVWSVESNSNPSLAIVTIDSVTGDLLIQGQIGSGIVQSVIKVTNTCGGCIEGLFPITVTVTAG
jgi:hypothetical protein